MLTLAFLSRLSRLHRMLLVLFLWPALAVAQQQLATLQGTITDQTGDIGEAKPGGSARREVHLLICT